jgi:hypothetical protein
LGDHRLSWELRAHSINAARATNAAVQYVAMQMTL